MIEPTLTVANAIRSVTRRLAEAKIEGPARDARLLVAAAASLSPEALFAHPEAELLPNALVRLETAVLRRLAREPIARIQGHRAFYGRDFAISPDVLDPRPDTEILVELALVIAGELRLGDADARPAPPLRILDIGTGSGAIIVTLLAERPDAIGVATDLSAAALDIAAQNARTHGVSDRLQLVETDLVRDLAGTFEIIVSNPPYIASGDIAGLADEVKYCDPRAALDGGVDGIAFYRRIAKEVPPLMSAGGWLAVEVGCGQASEVEALFINEFHEEVAPYDRPDAVRAGWDLSGIHRCVAVKALSV